MASLGAYKSIANTPLVFDILNNAWGFGGAEDISIFTDLITDGVAMSNAVFFPALAFAADFIVLTSIVALVVLKADEMLTASAGEQVDELCLVTEPVCGPVSFDSTDDYMCVEQWVDGKMSWVCA
jgi:hypothetical protein